MFFCHRGPEDASMRRQTILIAVVGLILVAHAGSARADELVRFPGDVPVDLYYSGGPIGFLNDSRWAVIPFWRPLASIPVDYNLLDSTDPSAIDLPLLVKGIARIRDGVPPSWEVRGSGAVPFVFVKRSEMLDAIDDDELTIGELLDLPSTRVGTAAFYQEQNHLDRFHPVSHYAVVGRGKFDNGRSFYVQLVEVELELIQAKIVFK
jgi:hypothetical protein